MASGSESLWAGSSEIRADLISSRPPTPEALPALSLADVAGTPISIGDDEIYWVNLARAHNPDAIGWLYERYFDRIYRYICPKIGDPREAEDLTEQVFLKMIEAIGDFQWQGTSFAAWLYRIAHNKVVDALRHQARYSRVSIDPLADLLPSDRDDPQGQAEQTDLRRHLAAAIGQLTDLQAQVIKLKFGARMSNAQVAAALGRTEGAIKALQYSALQNLSKLLTEKGFEP